MSKSRIWLLAAAVVVVAVAATGWWFLFRDDAPEATNPEQARETLDEEGSDGASTGDADLAGTWSVDATVGSFDDFSGTYAGYRIDEELANIGASEAVGRTPGVTGTITIAGTQVTDGSFDVDVTTLQSDEDQRDNQLRGRGLETDTFPSASFALTEPIELPDDATSVGELTFSAAGELTLHGVTNSVTIELVAQFANGRISLNGSAPVVLADYEIEPPEGFRVISVADEGTFEFQVFLSRS